MLVIEGLKCLELGISECRDGWDVALLLYASLLIISYFIEGNYESYHSLLASFSTSVGHLQLGYLSYV